MSALTAIPPIPPGYAVPRVDLTPREATLIPGVQGPGALDQPPGVIPGQPAGDSFAHMLGRMVEEVNDKQIAAGDAVNALQSGQTGSLHQAVIAMEEASVSFQLMVEVRNKLLDSYQELMRMQI